MVFSFEWPLEMKELLKPLVGSWNELLKPRDLMKTCVKACDIVFGDNFVNYDI